MRLESVPRRTSIAESEAKSKLLVLSLMPVVGEAAPLRVSVSR